jgi:hypothetical protein
LARVGMRSSPWSTLMHIRQMNDLPVRCWLLVTAAQAVNPESRKAAAQGVR